MLKKTTYEKQVYIWLYKNSGSLTKNNVRKQIDGENERGFFIKIAHTNAYGKH